VSYHRLRKNSLPCRELVKALQVNGFFVAIETNGTVTIPDAIDWVCVSPKADAELSIVQGHELKLVFPQIDVDPNEFSEMSFDHFLLQPMDGPQLKANTDAAIEYCLRHPKWRLSIQSHKLLGLP
jgi:7-carboxy-7-deazaguanine synthase